MRIVREGNSPLQRTARLTVNSLLAILFFYALAPFFASFLPYEWVAREVHRFASGSAQPISSMTYGDIVLRLRWVSAVLVVAWLSLFCTRNRLAIALEDTCRHWNSVAYITPSHIVASVSSYIRYEPLTAACILVIIAIGIAVRYAFVNQPMRFDESWTYISFARMPLFLVPIRYNAPNNHILNTLLIKLSTTLLGNSPETVRLPAFLFGVGLIPICYGFARSLISRGTAVIAAALVATSSPLIEYSTNGRGYTAVCFFFVAMLWAGRRAVVLGSSRRWAIVIACGALGALTIPIMVIPAAAAFLWFYLLIVRSQGRVWGPEFGTLVRATFALAIVAALLYMPVVAVNGWHALTQPVPPDVSRVATPGAIYSFAQQVLSIWNRDYGWYLARGMMICAMLSPLIAWRHRDHLALLVAATAAAVALYVTVVPDLGFPRVWLFMLPLYLIMVASAVGGLIERALAPFFLNRARCLGVVQITLALGLSLWIGNAVLRRGSILVSQETGVFPGAKAAARALVGAQSGDIVAINVAETAPFLYYSRLFGISMSPTKTVGGIHYYMLEVPPAMPGGEAPLRRWLFIIVKKDDTRVSSPANVVPALSGHFELVAEDTQMAVYRLAI